MKSVRRARECSKSRLMSVTTWLTEADKSSMGPIGYVTVGEWTFRSGNCSSRKFTLRWTMCCVIPLRAIVSSTSSSAEQGSGCVCFLCRKSRESVVLKLIGVETVRGHVESQIVETEVVAAHCVAGRSCSCSLIVTQSKICVSELLHCRPCPLSSPESTAGGSN